MSHVDYLSRFLDDSPDPLRARMCFEANAVVAELAKVNPSGIPSLAEVIAAQQTEAGPRGRGYQEIDGVVYYHGRIHAPDALRYRIIHACHDCAPFLHPGIKKTCKIVGRAFDWPGRHKDIVRYVQGCLYCARARSGKERMQGLLAAHPSTGPFQRIHIDFWTVTYGTEHQQYLTIVDPSTKWAEVIPCEVKSSQAVVELLFRYWFSRFGFPEVIVSDNDSTFVSHYTAEIIAKYGCTTLRSTPYHPEGNAPVERFHGTLNSGLKMFSPTTTTLQVALDHVLWAYRATPHVGTGNSPAFLTFGHDPRLSRDTAWRHEPNPGLLERFRYLAAVRLEVQHRANIFHQQQLQRANAGRTPRTFEVGQFVLLHEVGSAARRHHPSRYKATPQWGLPCRVERVLFQHRKSALVRSLVTGRVSRVHIQDVKFIQPPICSEQTRQWEDVLLQTSALTSREAAEELLRRWFSEAPQPQLDLPENEAGPSGPSRKRGRVRSPESGKEVSPDDGGTATEPSLREPLWLPALVSRMRGPTPQP